MLFEVIIVNTLMSNNCFSCNYTLLSVVCMYVAEAVSRSPRNISALSPIIPIPPRGSMSSGQCKYTLCKVESLTNGTF